MSNKYSGITVNLVTGFLGAGKTTVIKHLLSQVPEGERWAVLVNEFGEIGIDGAFLSTLDQGAVAVKEIAGGCLCCVSSAAFQVGLNQLIKQYKPTRILIEPTGLGHPQQILDQLTAPHYQEVLQLEATICLVDARHLADKRYREHTSFIDQIQLADVLVATKSELYSEIELMAFHTLAQECEPQKKQVAMIEKGALPIRFLDMGRNDNLTSTFPHAHKSKQDNENIHTPTKNTKKLLTGVYSFQKVEGEIASISWVLDDFYYVNETALFDWLKRVKKYKSIMRIKAMLRVKSIDDMVELLQINTTPLDQEAHRAPISKTTACAKSKLEMIINASELRVGDEWQPDWTELCFMSNE